MDDIQKWRASMLARNGGFSLAFIASRVFDKQLRKVTEADKAAVTYYLRTQSLKLRDWRDGKSPLAVAHANSAVKPKSKYKYRSKTPKKKAM